MGFFKDFKDDLSQAVNELMPEEMFDDNQVVNTLDEEPDQTEDTLVIGEETLASDDIVNTYDDNVDMDILDAILTSNEDGEDIESLKDMEEPLYSDEDIEQNNTQSDSIAEKEEKVTMDENKLEDVTENTNEVTVITKGTVINGSINADGSLDVMGTIKGDVECLGKLSIYGTVSGNCMAHEVFVGSKRLEGSISSEGSVKVGLGTVIIGDITASSGVIAGAVKGEIDINGPIIIDSSAVVKGNIKAQSIQINNGAVIEGFCSLPYASVDIENIFE